MHVPKLLIRLHLRVKQTCGWKHKWKILSVAPFAITPIIFAGYTIYNHLAEKSYQQFVQSWEAKGETLDMDVLFPPPPPVDQDFCSHHAVLAELALPTEDRLNTIYRMPITGITTDSNVFYSNNHKGTYKMGISSNIGIWLDPAKPSLTEKEAATEILALIAPYQKRIDLITEAASRPSAFYERTMDDKGEFISNDNYRIYSTIGGTIKLLGNQSHCLLISGNEAKAAENFNLSLLLVQHAQRNHSLIGFLIGMGSFSLIEEPLWQGLNRRAWDDETLAHFEKQLKGINYHQIFLDRMRDEMGYQAMLINIIHNDRGYLDRQRKKMASTFSSAFGSPPAKPTWKERGQEAWEKIKPHGWYLKQGTKQLELFEKHLFYPGGEKCTHLTIEQADAFALEKNPLYDPAMDVLSSGDTMEVYASQISRALHAQASLHNMRTAIALERFRLKQHTYPPTLNDLVPEFLPEVLEDVITREPLHYEIKPDGTPLIYSIGSDKKDDGGKPNKDNERGDWSWMYSPPAGFTYADYRKC